LNERSWGIYEGTAFEKVFQKLDKMDINTRFNYKPKGGESWKEFEKRLLVTIEEIVERNEGKTVAIVTHGGTIRALIPILKKVPREISFEDKIANNSLTIFKLDEGGVEEELINDISHLQ
jgi:broad specificity phosphatase PhoE